jgi:hypothetical protein
MGKRRFLAACGAVALGIVAYTHQASATIWAAWPWSQNQAALSVLYADHTGNYPAISSQTYNAAWAWDQTNTPADYVSNSGGYGVVGTVSIYVSDNIPDSGSYGWTSYSTSNGRMSGATITIRPSVAKWSAPAITQLLTHEMGHGLGLGHADGFNCYSVMYHTPGSHYTQAPAGYDESDLNTDYPNAYNAPSHAC